MKATNESSAAEAFAPIPWIDLECEMIRAHSRLRALAFLLEQSATGPNEFESSCLTAIGQMIAEWSERANSAFYGLLEHVLGPAPVENAGATIE